MKSIICENFGPLDTLIYKEIDIPKIKNPDDILIKVFSSGVNFPDGLLVQGKYQFKPPLPFTPGMEVSGEVFNAGYENKTVLDLANTVKKVIGEDVELKSTPTNDNRSYHISSEKIKKVLGFESKFTISDAVTDLKIAFKKGLLPNSLHDDKYFNIKRMQSTKLI